MATIRSYTTIEQSKVLAEILPLESADMTYRPIMDIDSMSNSGFLNIPECYPFNEFKNCTIKPLPCWSLAALLDIIPLGIETHKQTDGDKIYYYVETYMKCMGKETYLSTERHENLIDACYEMILKLHELKML